MGGEGAGWGVGVGVGVGVVLDPFAETLYFVWKQFQVAVSDSHRRTGNLLFL